MTEFNDDKPPVLNARPAPPAAPRSPLFARLLNVIAVPGHVFEEVRRSRHSAGNWLLTLPTYALSLGLFAAAVFSTPTIQSMFEQVKLEWRKAQSEQLTEQVKAKRITQADADETMRLLEFIARPDVAKLFAAGTGCVVGIARILWWALVIRFLAAAALRTRVSFGKAMEVVGLASVVAIVGNLAIVTLAVDFGKTFSSEGFTLTVNDFARSGNQVVVALLQNGLNFWLVAVLGTGLARLTDQPWLRGMFLIGIYWIATDLILLALGAGFAR